MYKVNNKEFNELKEALNYKNELELKNRDNLYLALQDKYKQTDATLYKI